MGFLRMFMALILMNQTAFAQSIFKIDDKTFCMNQAGTLRIISKIGPNVYEVMHASPIDYSTSFAIDGNRHMVLLTNNKEFDSEGIISSDIWVKTTLEDKPEIKRFPATNGFKKDFQVIRESAECERLSKLPSKLTGKNK
jgi:hypothetical protein